MLSASDLKPLQYKDKEIAVIRPGQGYWRRVLNAFLQQKAGTVALIFLVVLIVASAFSGLLWSVEPHIQNPSQRFLGPSGVTHVIVENDSNWHGPKQPVVAFEAVKASSLSVRLQWPQQQQTLSLFRYEQAGGSPLLLYQGIQNWYEDRFDLSNDAYRYVLVNEQQQPVFELETPIQPAISAFFAELADIMVADDSTATLPAHPLGTDSLGRDVLARLLHGGQITLGLGIFAPLLATLIGTFYGAIAGFVGGRVDEILMRIADFVIALPFLLFVILLNVALGYGPASSGVVPMFLALVIMGWPNAAKLVRGQTLLLRESAYIDAARLMGGSSVYIVKTHILPAVLGAVLIALTYAIPSAIFTEALLSFIGLGVKSPEASWGSLCQEAMSQLQRHPQLLLYPSGLICVTVLAFNLLGDSLRDALSSAGGQSE